MKILILITLLSSFLFANEFNAKKSFANDKVSWQVIYGQNDKTYFFSQCYKHKDKVKISLFLQNDTEQKKIFTLIIKDNKWYLKESKRQGIYRPYEVPLPLTNSYYYLNFAKLQFFNKRLLSRIGKKIKDNDQEITYNQGFLPKAKTKLQQQLALLYSQYQQAERKHKKAIFNKYQKLKNYSENGDFFIFDKKTNILMKKQSYGASLTIKNLKFDDSFSDEIFNTEDIKEDYTSFYAKPNLIACSAILSWQDQQTQQEDSYLLDPTSGKFVRIPFKGNQSAPGNFSKDRKTLFIAGKNTKQTSQIFKINLDKSTSQRFIISKTYDYSPKLSPNKKFLAYVSQPSLSEFKKAKIIVLDLTLHKKIYESSAMDLDSISWKNDTTLIYMQRKLNNKTFLPKIMQLDVTTNKQEFLALGMHPSFFQDKIFFINLSKGMWQLSSKNKFQFFDLENFGFADFSENGEKVVLIDYNQSPRQLALFDFKTKKTIPVTKDDTIAWSNPHWR